MAVACCYSLHNTSYAWLVWTKPFIRQPSKLGKPIYIHIFGEYDLSFRIKILFLLANISSLFFFFCSGPKLKAIYNMLN